MAPVMVCVVLTGMPLYEAKNNVAAAAVSAHTPPIGSRRVSLVPIVFTIFQPPNIVPRAIAAWHDSTIHSGRPSADVEHARVELVGADRAGRR